MFASIVRPDTGLLRFKDTLMRAKSMIVKY